MYKTKIKDVHNFHKLQECIVDEWDKLDKRFVDKPLDSGERDFDLVWLQKKDSLNIRCEHFLLLTFCHALFLKGNLFDCLLVD